MNFRDKVTSLFKDRKKLVFLCALVAVGIFLICISSFDGGEKTEKAETLDEYKVRLEAELADMCADVSGVGKCRVSVSFERGEENTYKGTLLTESKPPRVLGVSVICKGADSDTVRAALTDMICALFDIGANRVAVLKMKN